MCLPPQQHGLPFLCLMPTSDIVQNWPKESLSCKRYDASRASTMIPACLKCKGLQEDAKAIFHFSVMASTAQGLQNPRWELKTSLHQFQRYFSKKCFILTLGCVKMMGRPKSLAANCLAPVVFTDTQSRLSFLGSCLEMKVTYCTVKGKF